MNKKNVKKPTHIRKNERNFLKKKAHKIVYIINKNFK